MMKSRITIAVAVAAVVVLMGCAVSAYADRHCSRNGGQGEVRWEGAYAEGGNTVTIRLGTKLYGSGSPGAILLKREIESRQADVPVKVDTSRIRRVPVSTRSVNPYPRTGPFTSLIVDTRGFDIARAMSPKVRRSDGSEVWGTIKVSPDYAIETGIVSYERAMAQARGNRRCGSNPLIVTAIGRGQSAADCDVVISDEDARLILDENGKTRFLDQCNVIFLVDPQN